MHLLWRDECYASLNITADLAVCYQGEVIKRTRYFKETDRETTLLRTYHIEEQKVLKSLRVHVRQGYILAKAIRITDISQPGNIETFELQETIKTDDVISSFILKACLFNDIRNTGFFLKEEFFDCFTPYDVCTKIYELLYQYLNEK